MNTCDGIYIAYLTGASGQSALVFIFKDEVITGFDLDGSQADGFYSQDQSGDGFQIFCKFKIPKNVTLIQGQNIESEGLSYDVRFRLPEKFWSEDYVQVNTPYGPVNARIRLIRKFAK